MTAFGSPVVPLLNNRAAVVFLAVFSSVKRIQSASPCIKSSCQEEQPLMDALRCSSKSQTLGLVMPHACAAFWTFLAVAGSVTKNVALEILK